MVYNDELFDAIGRLQEMAATTNGIDPMKTMTMMIVVLVDD